MRHRRAVALAGALTLLGGCQDFLDVNTNPNAPETVAANLYLPPMLYWMGTSPVWDGRFIARYTQQLMLPTTTATPSTWDRMGYDPASDNGGQQWRDVYWNLGQNLVDMMEIASAEQRWDVLGVGYILKAWGWQSLANIHGEIIVKEAIDQTKFSFNYDSQQYAYEESLRLLDSAIVYLQRTDGAVDAAYLARGDKVYNGVRTQWLKFAYGLKGMTLNHYSNKASYNPQAVITAINSSFTSNADDALMTYPNAQSNDDINFMGRARNNYTGYRQTEFAVSRLNGTVFGVVDPRLSRMLSPSPDGQYRGLDPKIGNSLTSLPAAQRPNNPMGYPDAGGLQLPGTYLFDDKAKVPMMTYSQLQFVKAEAAFRAGDRATALQAYTNGVSAHIDMVNARNSDAGQRPTQITAAEKAAYLASPLVIPTAANLTLTHIMNQKYIALWGWGHNELWMDMRRYHYTDIDPATGDQVYTGFTLPTNFYPDNQGKPVYRLRPRFNSEYVWNIPGLEAIGGLATDYHTVPVWIIQP